MRDLNASWLFPFEAEDDIVGSLGVWSSSYDFLIIFITSMSSDTFMCIQHLATSETDS